CKRRYDNIPLTFLSGTSYKLWMLQTCYPLTINILTCIKLTEILERCLIISLYIYYVYMYSLQFIFIPHIQIFSLFYSMFIYTISHLYIIMYLPRYIVFSMFLYLLSL